MSGSGALLDPEQYMTLLVQRANEDAARADAARATAGLPPLPAWGRPLPEMMIRDGDDLLVDMAAIHGENARAAASDGKTAAKPRVYQTAAHWRKVIRDIDARLDAINGIQRHDTDDPAAYGGLGVRQSSRQRAAYGARVDRAAAEHIRLTRKRADVLGKLRRAELRESK